jgi:exonuclease III
MTGAVDILKAKGAGVRIATWNCKKGLDKKIDALLSLDADVAVVPECSEKSLIALRQRGFTTLWFGYSDPHILGEAGTDRKRTLSGVGIVCRQDRPIRALPQPEQKWIVPVEIDSPTPFILIAVWACRVGSSGKNNYIGQIYQALMAHPEWFEGNPVVVAGDFNSNKIWDFKRKVGNHSGVVKLLEERGLVSAYHEKFNEVQGAETCPTLHLLHNKEKPYHIDYVFIPREWIGRLRAVEVGKYEDWSKRSDHCPVVVDIL